MRSSAHAGNAARPVALATIGHAVPADDGSVGARVALAEGDAGYAVRMEKVSLEAVLPLIRLGPTTLRERNLNTDRVLAVYRDSIVIFEKKKRVNVPPTAHEADGIAELLQMPSVGEKWVANLQNVDHAVLGPEIRGARALLLARGTDASPKWLILASEDPRLIAALKELLGTRFRLDPLLPPCAGMPENPVARRARLVAGAGLTWAVLSSEDTDIVKASAAGHVIGMAAVAAALLLPAASLVAYFQPLNSLVRALPRLARAPGRLPFRSPVLGAFLRFIGTAVALCGLAVAEILWSLFTEPMSFNVARKLGPVYYFLKPFLLAPATLILVLGYRLSQKTGDPLALADRRSPVVFLRSFGDDGRATLNPPGALSQALGLEPIEALQSLGPIANVNPLRLLRLALARPTDTAEEQLARYLKTVGPFVAIGRPGELLRPGGAARRYFDQSRWQQEVVRLVREAALIVIQPDISPGVWWEVETVLKTIPRHRVLMSLAHCQTTPEHWESIRLRLEPLLRAKLPRSVTGALFIRFDEAGDPVVMRPSYNDPVVWPLTGQAVDLEMTLMPFISGLSGASAQTSVEPNSIDKGAAIWALVIWFVAAIAFDWLVARLLIELLLKLAS